MTARTIEAEASRRSRTFPATRNAYFILSSDYNSPWNSPLEISNSQNCNISFFFFITKIIYGTLSSRDYGSRVLSGSAVLYRSVVKLTTRIHFRHLSRVWLYSGLHQAGARVQDIIERFCMCDAGCCLPLKNASSCLSLTLASLHVSSAPL